MNGICRLCLEGSPLRESHVFPALLHRQLADENNRAVELMVSLGRTRSRQSLEWEHLLCGACEQRLNRYETYFSLVWYEHPLIPARYEHPVFLRGLDYRRFKLFHLSILWRAAVSSRAPFDNVSLGPHAERIRRQLLADDPGPPQQYPLAARFLLDDDSTVHHRVVFPYFVSHADGHHHYLALYAGCEWLFTISNHSHQVFSPAHLSADGAMRLTGERLVRNPGFLDRFVTFLRNESASSIRPDS